MFPATVEKLVLAAVLVLSLGACGSEDDDQAVSPTPDDQTPDASPTPWPLSLEDGGYDLWNAYVLPSGEYILEPTGQLALAADQLTGTVRWNIYASLEDYNHEDPDDRVVLCEYPEEVSGAPDESVVANPDCEGCGTYYGVSFAPEGETDCDSAAMLALLDRNGDGSLAAGEIDHSDTWGFSVLGEGTWPSAWTTSSSWEDREDYLSSLDVRYAAWSRQWFTEDSAYLPLFALYPPTEE